MSFGNGKTCYFSGDSNGVILDGKAIQTPIQDLTFKIVSK